MGGHGDTTQGAGGGQPPGHGGGAGGCGLGDSYCAVKGYLVATVLGLLLLLVAAVHIMTRDKATKAGGEVTAGPRAESEPAAPQGASPWQQ